MFFFPDVANRYFPAMLINTELGHVCVSVFLSTGWRMEGKVLSVL